MDREKIVCSRRELLRTVSMLGLAGAAHIGECQPPPHAAPAGTAKQARRPLFVLGYYPDWTNLEPSQIDFALFTHLCHAFARVNKAGPLHFPDAAQTQALIRRAHAKKTCVLL